MCVCVSEFWKTVKCCSSLCNTPVCKCNSGTVIAQTVSDLYCGFSAARGILHSVFKKPRLAKPAGLHKQSGSPEGWTIRQLQDHWAVNQSQQGTLIKQPSPAQPAYPHRAIKSIPFKTPWKLSGEKKRMGRKNSRNVSEEKKTANKGKEAWNDSTLCSSVFFFNYWI